MYTLNTATATAAPKIRVPLRLSLIVHESGMDIETRSVEIDAGPLLKGIEDEDLDYALDDKPELEDWILEAAAAQQEDVLNRFAAALAEADAEGSECRVAVALNEAAMDRWVAVNRPAVAAKHGLGIDNKRIAAVAGALAHVIAGSHEHAHYRTPEHQASYAMAI